MPLPKVAYFSMEMAIDASLKTYSGGLGFLAGSHMLSAGQLNLPMVGVCMLWTKGYGEQEINADNQVEIVYTQRDYPFLEDRNIVVEVPIFGEPVKVKALYLKPETFGTVPVYYLTTNIPENKPEHRSLTDVLYDKEQRVRIAQEIILGRAGYLALEAAGETIDLVHINEGHALPVFFEMLSRANGNLEDVKRRAVFTTHTPVAYGNESHPVELLAEAGFFADIPTSQAIWLGGHDFSLTVAALRMSRMSNAVSQLHGEVANDMWSWVEHRSPIKAITNAVNLNYWQDPRVAALKNKADLWALKKEMKRELFDYVKQETGKDLDPDVLTIVWARRFTGYKRPGLIFREHDRIDKLIQDGKIQLLFAGKFHPSDTVGRDSFNLILEYASYFPGMAILKNYDLALSGLLKRGADVWLNTPLRPMEASGTSGMAANMNGAIHVSTYDGWAVEGTYDGINGYIINETVKNDHLSVEERNQEDYNALMQILENKILPTYYHNQDAWLEMAWNAIHTSSGYFHSHRMVIEYFNRLYKPVAL